MKQVLQLDQDGYFIGITEADESPLEKGVYLIPANALDLDMPLIPDGKTAQWNGENWVFEDILQPEPEPELTESELAEQEKQKKIAEALGYLESTDWIVTKITELQLEGVDIEPLKTKYAEELAERKLMREAV